ncbi:MAG: hypothetical protein PSV36_15010 [Algoriphagus sp.]|nr:hypothetical protein [Algoriphagus sp.]
MNSKENILSIYPNLGYWLMLFILSVFGGFYHSYFSVFLEPHPSLIHFHFIFMSIWLGIVIAQPLLIRYKKLAVHRKVGRLSYIILPLVLLSSWQVMRYAYSRDLTVLNESLASGATDLTLEEGLIGLASYSALGMVYFVWLAIFYGLAIVFKKQTSIHARFMIAAAMTFMGPTVDRILFNFLNIASLPPGIPIEYISFAMIDIILLALLIKDIRKNRNTIPLYVSLGLYVLVQIFYATLTKTSAWEKFISIFLG